MRTITLSLFLLCLLVGCGEDDATDAGSTGPGAPPDAPGVEPDHISVDHILIPVKNPELPPRKRIPTAMEEEEARKLAYEILELLEGGADWASMKRRYSADGQPGRQGGPYALANHGVTARRGEEPRERMVSAFGDVGFKLKVGEMGMADFDRKTSVFGFHIIKRVK